MTSWNRSKYGSVLLAARAELGESLADDPLAQHIALQIEAMELALESRVDLLVEKRDEEKLYAAAQAEEDALHAEHPAVRKVDEEARQAHSAARYEQGRYNRPPRPSCMACGAASPSPHQPDCSYMATVIKGM